MSATVLDSLPDRHCRKHLLGRNHGPGHLWCILRAAGWLLGFGTGAVLPLGAAPVFVNTTGPDGPGGAGGGVISFGVAPLGGPVNPGVPLYLPNNFNGRSDILINPGVGRTANLSVPNNTSSVLVGPWAPPLFLYNQQVGGGNVHGPFGSGEGVIYGETFGFKLADGGVPGGVSASYQILTWDATFQDPVGTAAGDWGTYIAMAGSVPLVQDVAVLALRTELRGPNLGVVEVPGLILAVERTGPATYNALALQDNLGGAATPMPGGWGIRINPATGRFLALAYNVFPFAIPAGETFTARVTATVIADPADIEFPTTGFRDLFAELDTDPGMQAFGGGPAPAPPSDWLFESVPVPEPSVLSLLLLGLGTRKLLGRRTWSDRA